ncbi:MAG: MoaD/ThiS family protein [Elusimicrobia bacterium]|nr:MoaD/ThiS family protein [Elusimicrobiota bacterium]
MAQILIKLYTTLRLRLKKEQVWVQAQTAAEAVAKVAELGGPETRKVLFDSDGKTVRNEFVLALDSDILDRRRLDAVKLKEGMVLHLFPPISGG